MALDITSYALGKKAGGGSGGTSNYNDLSNKPQINDVVLSGNKTTSDLGLQEIIDSTHKLDADYIDDTNTTNKLTNATEKSTWNGKQDALVSGTNIKTINNTSLLGSGNLDTEIIQYSTLPTASSSNEGKIVQYTGTTDANYTNGYFYRCVSDGQDTATYFWENIQVQAGGGSSTPQYIEDGDGNKLYFVKDFTDNNTYKNNIVKPILQEIINDYKNGKKDYLIVGGSKSRYIETTGIYHITQKYSNYYKLMSNMNTVRNESSTYSSSGYSDIMFQWSQINVYIDSNDIITSIGNIEGSDDTQIKYISTTDSYSSPFTPTQPGHPANKKYVDDSIASAIGTALQGSY